MLRYRLFALMSWLTLRAPRRLTYAIAALIGELAYIVNLPARRVCEDNVRHVIGPAASARTLRRAVRGCFRAGAKYYADLGRTPLMDPQRFVERNVEASGFEHIERAYAAGTGVIVATIHYGNPEYVAQSMSARGIRFLALVEPLDPEPLAELFGRLRASQGQTFVEVGWTGGKAALRHLKAGGAVCIVCDRDIQRAGERVPFFGATARIPSGAVDLARHTGAPIIPAVTRRVGFDCFQLSVEPPLDLIKTRRHDADRRANTARLIQCFEKYLRADPSQWFVMEQRVWGEDAGDQAAPSPNPSPAARGRGA